MTAVHERPPAETPTRSRRRISLPKVPRAPKRRSTPGIVAGWVAGVTALLASWFVLYALVISSLQTSHDQQVLYSKFREQLAGETAPFGATPIAPDAPVALLTMPSAGLRDEIVVEGTASGDLTNGPGHSRSTVLPGQVGTSVLYGRATLFGGPFADVARAHVGDLITMVTGQGKSTYSVSDVRHSGDPFPAALPAGGARLTLATADGSGWRTGWAPNHTVYVDATLQGKAFPVPQAPIAAVPDAERAMQNDPSALYQLVLWLPLLALACGSVVWAHQRWGAWQTWLVGAPIVLACLWGVSGTAVRLLPNLM